MPLSQCLTIAILVATAVVSTYESSKKKKKKRFPLEDELYKQEK
ncbi:hypothetical protein [Sulfurimonas sp.]|nr:hypothetical protein [Sulfurimonas sp.]MDD5158107.1 hypothetical protein [Sulfurimonas sp.]